MTIIIEWLNSHPPMLNLSTGQKNYETYFYQSTATPVPATGNVSITTMNHGPNYITNASVNIINGIYYYQLGVCLPTCVHPYVTCVHPYVTPLCYICPPLCHTLMSHGPTPMSHEPTTMSHEPYPYVTWTHPYVTCVPLYNAGTQSTLIM